MTADLGGQNPKVLFAISNIAIGGGAEKVAVMVANQFLKQGISTKLLTFYSAKNEHKFDGQHISLKEPTRDTVFGKLFRAPHRIWSIKQVCKKNNIDLVISFLEESNYYALLSKLLLGNKARIIVSVRNDPTKYPWHYQYLIKILYPHAEKVVAVTKGIESILKDHYGLTNTTTIYNPVDYEQIQIKATEPLPEVYKWIEERSPLFINIGRLTRQKGQWHLIRAFAEVVKQNATATLIIIGEGPYREKLTNLINDLKLENNVFLLGKQENVYPFLKASKVFVLPSLWEGMPNVLLEALAVGCKIIATDASTGAREILAPEVSLKSTLQYSYQGKYGTLISPFEPEEDSVKENCLSKFLFSLIQSEYVNQVPTDKRFGLNSVVGEWKNIIKSN